MLNSSNWTRLQHPGKPSELLALRQAGRRSQQARASGAAAQQAQGRLSARCGLQGWDRWHGRKQGRVIAGCLSCSLSMSDRVKDGMVCGSGWNTEHSLRKKMHKRYRPCDMIALWKVHAQRPETKTEA